MFENVGASLKVVAAVLCILGIIASVIGAVALWVQDDRYVGSGIMVLVGGCAGSMIAGMVMYGFGQLIENSDMQVTLLRKMERQLSTLREESAPDAKPAAATVTQAAFVPKAPRENRWKCNECGYDYNVEGKTSCDICGSRR